ncbi:DUF177 domain-containing protein [Ruminococcaceae bacterium OttesenSCG-928-I18]|nr:DUF177 domain-containing protein [Ruminococcaceae bacterium OttesenSCG-928-I18]
MELNLQKLLSAKGERESGDRKLDFSSKDFGSFTVPSPAQMHYDALGENGAVTLEVVLRATIYAECARCLVPIKRGWQVQKEYRITRADLLEEYPELPYTPDGWLDLDELAYGELLLDVDPVLVCSEDCQGLCPKCGQARAECRCPAESEGDERLAILKQLLEERDTNS